MYEHDWIVVGPLVHRQVVKAAVLVAALSQPVQAGFLPFVEPLDELVAELQDKGEDRDVQVLVKELVAGHIPALGLGCERAGNGFGCLQDLEQQDICLLTSLAFADNVATLKKSAFVVRLHQMFQKSQLFR